MLAISKATIHQAYKEQKVLSHTITTVNYCDKKSLSLQIYVRLGFQCIYIYVCVDIDLEYLVGGFKHFLLSI